MSDPYAITVPLAGSRANHTGTWRVERPEYITRVAPCTRACPAGEDPRAWLAPAEEGDYRTAWDRLVDVNPFPAIMGRVCYRPCETACNRGLLDESVGINAVERFLGDEAVRRGWRLPGPGEPSGRRVLVVGAGPCGLAAAYHLRRLGHETTVLDGEERAGGMLTFGIPAYRLPRAVLADELDRLLELGVDLRLRERVTDLAGTLAAGEWDAAVVAVGARIGQRVELPAADTTRVLDALGVLHGVAEQHAPVLGRRVAVYGGGDTALDAARTARRLGAADAVIVYRRTRERMPAHAAELEEATAEGIRVRWLSTIGGFEAGHVRIEKVRPDGAGGLVATGETEDLPADTVVLAVGQRSDLSLLDRLPGVAIAAGTVTVDAAGMTGRAGVFAGGDAVGGERTVTAAIGDGCRAALGVDRWLRTGSAGSAAPGAGDEATFEHLNPWYYADAPHQVRPVLEASRRVTVFDEVVGGLEPDSALFEARRCLSCGSCLGCDNCYGVCPDNAVRKLEPGSYRIDLDYCKGCGLCVAECPSGSMRMVPEII